MVIRNPLIGISDLGDQFLEDVAVRLQKNKE